MNSFFIISGLQKISSYAPYGSKKYMKVLEKQKRVDDNQRAQMLKDQEREILSSALVSAAASYKDGLHEMLKSVTETSLDKMKDLVL